MDGSGLVGIYVFVLRRDLTLLPLSMSIAIAIGKIADGVAVSHPGSAVGTTVGSIAVLALGAAWTTLHRGGSGTVAKDRDLRF